jgi:hypothetical protein
MANKLKPHTTTLVGPPAKTTRLGKALRDLARDHPDHEWRLKHTADALDMAVISLNKKGDGIKSLASYYLATRLYHEVSGVEYQPTR